MGDWHDYVALEWVKGEIAETLKQARQALETFVENPQDLTRMRFCLTYVHQVRGTLQMVEFFGAALLAEEMESLAQAMIEGRISNQNEALEVLMQAILQLPAYLDRVQEARRDLPMVLLPLLNDLRAACGATLLSETSLFSPDMSSCPGVLSAEALALLNFAEFPALLRKLRQVQLQALVGVMRGQDLPINLGYLARVFARLESLCKDAPLGLLWKIASALIEGLAVGSVSNGVSVRSLLRQVDRELKRLVEQGNAAINQAAPVDLTKNLLFYIAKASTPSARINALKEQFKLDEALPDKLLIEDEQARLAGPDREAMRSVVTALCEELVRVKDSLDLFVRSDRQTPSDVETLLAPLKQIADTLAVLGFGQPRKVVLDQLGILEGMSRGEHEPSDPLLMDIAGALLYVEATLAGMAGPAEVARGEESLMPTTDVAQIHQVVIKEARNGLEQAKDAIVEFIASQWDHEHLKQVPALLTQIRGGLAMIPLPRAAALVDMASRYIQEQLLVRKVVPNWQSLDTLADAIAGVEYYLERVSEDRIDQGDQILDVAEDSLEILGYPLKQKASILDSPEKVEAEQPSAGDPIQEIDVLAVEQPAEDSGSQELTLSEPDSVEPLDDISLPELELADEPMEHAEVGELQQDEDTQLANVPSILEDELQIDEIELTDLSDDFDVVVESQTLVAVDEPEALLLEDIDLPLDEWDNSDISAIDLPDIDLPVLATAQPAVPADTPLSVADVMASPVQAINPPAQDAPQSLLPPPADEDLIDEDILEIFVEEAGEVLETLDEFLPQWCADTESKPALAEIRRAFHTLKGSGRMVRALVIGELGWSIENLLNRILDRSVAPDADVQQVITDVTNLLPELVAEFAAKAQRQRDDVDHLAARAYALARGEKIIAQEVEPEFVVIEPSVADISSVKDLASLEILDPQLLEIFINETESHLDTLRGFLSDCTQELPQPISDNLQRALHTLKGSAYMAGVLPIAEIAAPLEKLVKDYKVNLIGIDLAEVELLQDATMLFQSGLDQLETSPLEPIEGATEFLGRLQQLYEERLSAQAKMHGDESSARDPKLISIFLVEGMDILLDAESLLLRWRNNPAEKQEFTAILDELSTLRRGAEMAELPQIEAICQCLLECYTAVQAGRLPVSELFFERMVAAHESLINMVDQVAAGLEVSSQPDQIEAIHALLSQQLTDEAINLLEPDNAELLDIVQSEVDAAEAAQFKAEMPEYSEPVMVPVSPFGTADVGASDVQDELDEEMVEIFLEEALELVESSSHSLEKWLGDTTNSQALGSLLRDLHTLKGGARMAQVRQVGDLSHELETLYEGLVDGRYMPSAAMAGMLHQGHDLLAVLVEQMQAHQVLDNPAELIAALSTFTHGMAPSGQNQTTAESPRAVMDVVDFNEFELSDLSTAEFNFSTLELHNPADESLVSHVEIFTAVETEEMPSLSAAEWHLEAALPQLGAEPQRDISNFDESAESDDPELAEIFLEEAVDILNSAEASLHRWIANVENTLELESLLRDLHTLKGGARMAEIQEVGDLAHELEFLYEGLGAGSLRSSKELVFLLQSCHDQLALMIEALSNRNPIPSGDELIAAIKVLRADPQAQLSVPVSVHLQALEPAPVNIETETDILDIFIEEADALLMSMRASITSWGLKPEDPSPLSDLQRTLLTLKGGARLAGQSGLGDIAHDLEQLLNDIQQQGAPCSESQFSDVQLAFDGLHTEIELLRIRLSQRAPDTTKIAVADTDLSVAQTYAKFDLPIIAVSSRPAHSVKQAQILPFVQRAAKAAREAEANRAPQELVKVPTHLLEGLVNLAGETSIFRGRVEQQVNDLGFTLGEMEATIERVRDQLRRLDTETQAQILSRYQSETDRSGYEEFDLLEMDRHSQLQQLSRALFESASDLLDLKETLAVKNRDAETLLLQQARVNTELQEGLMRTRMVPFDRLVPRLRRIVRQVAGELGKQVEFNVGNAEGEMDRTVLERIVAPLEHMLRNAVDHGVESADVRLAAGKPEPGTITLSLGREGGDILLTLSDDGGGIRLDAVRRKAIDRGLMDADADLSDQEVLQFILEPGFSTAEKVTQISGRGVGMDVAHSEIKQLGGSMRIESIVGQGTRFLIRLPFTVSVNRALMVLSGEDLYAIPLNTIEGIVRVSPYELEALYQHEEGQANTPRFEYAGQAYDLKYLGDLLNNGQHPKLVGQSLPLPVILVRSNEHAMAVQVDSLVGSREIVVKSLGRQFAGVHGISGATILGDGRVVVILDLLATIRSLHAQQHQFISRSSRQLQLQAEASLDRATLVMVVDDSVTVRKVTTRLLERAGMNALTAKDGIDALTQLQDHRPDIILLDVEMPRMDGFELATLVRHDERLKGLPIIMITSRTGEKHRQRAMDIGVNEYLGKPYQESVLLETIARLVKSDD